MLSSWKYSFDKQKFGIMELNRFVDEFYFIEKFIENQEIALVKK